MYNKTNEQNLIVKKVKRTSYSKIWSSQNILDNFNLNN